jgi:hypothetical protein
MRNYPFVILLDGLGCISGQYQILRGTQREVVFGKHYMVDDVSVEVFDCKFIMKI